MRNEDLFCLVAIWVNCGYHLPNPPMNTKAATIFLSLGILSGTVFGQDESKQMVRLAKLVIDAAQLESFQAMLKKEIETSLKVEPGVLMLYAVVEKANPTHITILEIYANEDAYKKHIQSPHFLKYKQGTKDMVKSLVLVETTPLIPAMKIK